jgi:hypothetical protein
MSKKINIEISEENAALTAHYVKVRGLAGEAKITQKAMTAGTAAVNNALRDLFKGDKEFQEFLSTLPAEKKPRSPKPKPAALKGAAA